MSFKQYTNIGLVMEEFQITYQEEDFIQPLEFTIDEAFLKEFQFVKRYIDIRMSEFAICENILYPILKEVYKKYAEAFSLWSHKAIRYDKKLSGEPDYVVTTRSKLGKVVLGRPLVLVVEAKKNDFDQGWGQCLAEMVALQKLNDAPAFAVYGIVSDGEVWEMGRLVESTYTKQQPSFTTNDLKELFGAIDFVMNALKRSLEPVTSTKHER